MSGVALPETCSPEAFMRDGRSLVCFDLSDDADLDHFEYAVEREGSRWRRVSMPAEVRFPEWSQRSNDVHATQWSPAGDRVAFIRPTHGPYWFSLTGNVTVADADSSNERVVAVDGEAPRWSPDGKRLAFARCRVFEEEWLKDEFADRRAECSLWTVSSDGADKPRLLGEKAASAPVWSPDGHFVAFFRRSRSCESVCRSRIVIAPVKGGDAQEIGPELVEPTGDPPWGWPLIAWLPARAPALVPAPAEEDDNLELQRCVDIWNRARMHPWPTGAVNVSLVDGACQMTVSDYGGVCIQPTEMQFRFWCPSHGTGLHMLPPDYGVWNGHGDEEGRISLFDPPMGPRLPLPKAPPYPMLDGYVIPYGKDGEPLADLKLTETFGTCETGTGIAGRYPRAYADRYPERCWWHGSGSDHCFKHPGRLAVGDVVLCPQAEWNKVYDPLRFVKVKVAQFP